MLVNFLSYKIPLFLTFSRQILVVFIPIVKKISTLFHFLWQERNIQLTYNIGDCFVWIFNWHLVLVERNSKIIQGYEININPACGTLGGVFKLCLSFTLSPFECRSNGIPYFESGMLCISVISKEEKIWFRDITRIILGFWAATIFET